MAAWGNRIDLVFEGGGVKGVALAGAAARLTALGFEPYQIGGSSAGSIVASLYAAGYRDEDELRDLLVDVPFASFRDRSLLDHVPVAGPLLSIVGDLGIYEGDALEAWVAAALAAKGVYTFDDLVIPGSEIPKDDWVRSPDNPDVRVPPLKHRCQIVIADLTAREVLVWPRDAAGLGLEPSALSVARAVRASSAIPIFFEPVVLRDRDGVDHVLVDGGLLSNFPVWMFDVMGTPRWPTFGINLTEQNARSTPIGAPDPVPASPGRRHGLFDHVGAILGAMIEARDKLALANTDRVRTVDVPTLGVATTDFDLSQERAEELFSSGWSAVDVFLAEWDWQWYRTEVRI